MDKVEERKQHASCHKLNSSITQTKGRGSSFVHDCTCACSIAFFCQNYSFTVQLYPGPNLIALLTVQQIFVLTIAEKLLKHISRVSKKIEKGVGVFTMDLYCCVTHLLAITAGKLACLSLCLTVSSAMK